MQPRPAEPRPKTCAACGTSFACGPGTGATPGTCWCQDLPALPEIDPSKDCFCPTCLNQALFPPPSFTVEVAREA